jgi:hypothetical protein
MIVASISTATASPTPNCLNSSARERREDREYSDHQPMMLTTISAVPIGMSTTAHISDHDRTTIRSLAKW